ncbi:SDR family oxidoreductase [Azospirillum picis]|uniref:NAD(P)-dependent dehydrogenase (Short-subunit alcohol dehydrogenase family) n=1 Tax=Azospirillum picis TaxID=488438 RepID=A0ABU0MMC5_9PROT|nr:SDR family oxidoreductase [Azospirillum picis]MBP2301017.1 NAD(P)-dependent dehydrogenase (short-subunit alcohol dehydrogenase family) [Azospirillum picis]MDQ0534363.1 NAD(P)-dependent dehydrogenase (short-subunit alcohol dehydrogenase family) [Azospirillum picis]
MLPSNGSLPSPVVCITGASAGVGRATALAFAAYRRASIGLVARSAEALEEVRREVERLGGRAMVLPLDVADPDALENAAGRLEDAFGPIDIWINSAMVTVFGPVQDLTADELKRVTEVTYLGSAYGIQAALRRMRPRNRGTILQVGSALAYRSIPLQSAYCGAKHAIQGFIDSLRSELLHDGSDVRLTTVQLPAVNTPQFDWARSHMPRRAQPMGRIFQPEDIARAILHAAEHPRREYWLGGTAIQAILGNSLAPGLVDRYLADTAVEGQETGEPETPGRPDNLYHPVEGLHRTRGRFGLPHNDLRLTPSERTARSMAIATGLILAGGVGYALARGR